jgi:hypothetical protein
VSVPFNIACGRCRNCREGKTGICLNVNGDRAGAAFPPRPMETSPLFAMPGFGPASAPVASCGVLGFLEASSSYKIDYSAGGGPGPSAKVKPRTRVAALHGYHDRDGFRRALRAIIPSRPNKSGMSFSISRPCTVLSVAGGVIEQDLRTADALHNLAAESDASRAKPTQRRVINLCPLTPVYPT